jgi:hypothetical protein
LTEAHAQLRFLASGRVVAVAPEARRPPCEQPDLFLWAEDQEKLRRWRSSGGAGGEGRPGRKGEA